MESRPIQTFPNPEIPPHSQPRQEKKTLSLVTTEEANALLGIEYPYGYCARDNLKTTYYAVTPDSCSVPHMLADICARYTTEEIWGIGQMMDDWETAQEWELAVVQALLAQITGIIRLPSWHHVRLACSGSEPLFTGLATCCWHFGIAYRISLVRAEVTLELFGGGAIRLITTADCENPDALLEQAIIREYLQQQLQGNLEYGITPWYEKEMVASREGD